MKRDKLIPCLLSVLLCFGTYNLLLYFTLKFWVICLILAVLLFIAYIFFTRLYEQYWIKRISTLFDAGLSEYEIRHLLNCKNFTPNFRWLMGEYLNANIRVHENIQQLKRKGKI